MAHLGDMAMWAAYHDLNTLQRNRAQTQPILRKEVRRIRFVIQNLSQVSQTKTRITGDLDVGYVIKLRSVLQVTIFFHKQDPDDELDNSKTYLAIYFSVKKSDCTTTDPLTGTVSPRILKANGKILYYVEGDMVINFTALGQNTFGIMRFMDIDSLMATQSVVKDDTLLIEVEFTLFGKATAVEESDGENSKYKQLFNNLKAASSRTSSIGRDFDSLLETGDFSDIVLDVRGQKFKCHKCVLSARSQVFSTMFRSGYTESNSAIIQIDDIKPDTMAIILAFIYSGNLPKVKTWENNLYDILYAAEKYNLSELTGFLDATIKTRILTMKNLNDIMDLASMFSLPKTSKKILKLRRIPELLA